MGAALMPNRAKDSSVISSNGGGGGGGAEQGGSTTMSRPSKVSPSPQNPQDPPDDDVLNVNDDKESERRSDAVLSSAATDAAAAILASKRGDDDDDDTTKSTKQRKKKKKRVRETTTTMTSMTPAEDAAHLLSVLLRWVVFFSLAVTMASRWSHGRMLAVHYTNGGDDAADMARRAEQEAAAASACERVRNRYEACYGDAPTETGGGPLDWSVVTFGLNHHHGRRQCPVPPPTEDHRCHLLERGGGGDGGAPVHAQRLGAAQQWVARFVVDHNLLLLGFPTPSAVYVHIRECLLSALCWSLAFVLVRKGLNPDERRQVVASSSAGKNSSNYYCYYAKHIVQYKYWRGAGYGGLGVFHSAFLRGVVKNAVSREAFARCWLRFFVIAPLAINLATEEAAEHVVRGPLYDAVMVGLCWGIVQFLVKRRLDPKMNGGRGLINMIRKSWRDVAAGALALTTACLSRAALQSLHFSSSAPQWWASSPYCPRGLAGASRVGVCWGLTYLFIRRGLTTPRGTGGNFGFVAKYRNDAVCGSAAMFVFALFKPIARGYVAMYLERSSFYVGDSGVEGGDLMGPTGGVLVEEGASNYWDMCTAPADMGFASME